MSKMSELSALIAELRHTAHALEAVADGLRDLCGTDDAHVTPEETVEAVIELEKAMTLEDIRPILARKSAEGHGQKIQELIRSYGVDKLSKIPPEHYPDLLKAAEVL